MSRTKTIAGLDFGSHSIKAVWVERRSGRVRFLRAEELQLPPDAADPVRFIAPWLEKHGLLKCGVALALPGSQVVFQPMALAMDDPRTPEQAAEMELALFNDMAGETMTHSISSFRWDESTLRLLLAMVRPEVVGKALRGAAAFSLRVHELLPSPVALFNAAARTESLDAAPALLVHIGHTTTDVAVGTRDGLLFARSFSIGGKIFTDALARATGGTVAQVERLKRNEASLAAGGEHAEELSVAANTWLSQLRSTLAVYRGSFAGEEFAPAQVRLSGGGSLLKGLPEFVSEGLQVPCGLFAMQEAGPAFLPAYGLALAGLRQAVCPLSLLPRRMSDEIEFAEKKPYWLAAGICASLAVAVFVVSGIRAIGRERAAVEAESRRIAELRALDTRIRSLRAEIETVRELGEPLMELLRSGPVVRELVTLVANSINPDDWVTMICDEAVYVPPMTEEQEAKEKAKPRSLRDLKRPAALLPGAVQAGGSSAKQDADASAPAPCCFNAFIIEGYTPHSGLGTIRDLIERLLKSELVARADVLGDERVLPAAVAEDTEADDLMKGLTHFVVRVEVNRP